MRVDRMSLAVLHEEKRDRQEHQGSLDPRILQPILDLSPCVFVSDAESPIPRLDFLPEHPVLLLLLLCY